eukprot:GHVT01035972.1.p1 GENE.GHVT01035972.1~~GHVT01035972.1.p1  ORF type:complete len:157 (-),score=17.45 GHVT01035972.1:875-1345(-)
MRGGDGGKRQAQLSSSDALSFSQPLFSPPSSTLSSFSSSFLLSSPISSPSSSSASPPSNSGVARATSGCTLDMPLHGVEVVISSGSSKMPRWPLAPVMRGAFAILVVRLPSTNNKLRQISRLPRDVLHVAIEQALNHQPVYGGYYEVRTKIQASDF